MGAMTSTIFGQMRINISFIAGKSSFLFYRDGFDTISGANERTSR